MEIILKEDIIGLGYKNDIVKVKNGYGRNYLIPTGKGVIASESARKMLAENLRQQAAKLAAKKAEAEKRAAEGRRSSCYSKGCCYRLSVRFCYCCYCCRRTFKEGSGYRS